MQYSEIEQLKEIFWEMDKDKNGWISLEQIYDVFQMRPELKCYINQFHNLKNFKQGEIQYNEFLSQTLDDKLYFEEEKSFRAFSLLSQ